MESRAAQADFPGPPHRAVIVGMVKVSQQISALREAITSGLALDPLWPQFPHEELLRHIITVCLL